MNGSSDQRNHQLGFFRYSQRALIICMPIVALGIAARQVYLSNYHGLAVWKGGGMGMFASIDGGRLNRFAQLFITQSDGSRQPLTHLLRGQKEAIDNALNYPVRRNFLAVAKSIAAIEWASSPDRMPVVLIDSKGEPAGRASESYRMMAPVRPRPRDEKWKGNIQIEYWKLSYNPLTRTCHATQAQTFTFTPDEVQQ